MTLPRKAGKLPRVFKEVIWLRVGQAPEKKYEGFFPGHEAVSSERVGLAFAKSVEGAITGQVIIVE